MAHRFALAALTGGIAWLAATATVDAQTTCAAPGTAATACSGNCAVISVGTPSGAAGGPVQIPISFTQGPDDGQAGQGFDDVAAIAFTLGVPGTADNAAPLSFNCTNGDLADGSVTPGPDIASNFTVVVENAQCTNRTHCLCPDTSKSQTLDNFVNIVVYGPKNLPAQGPVVIPEIPKDKTVVLATLSMQIAASGAPSPIPLHVFSTLDPSTGLHCSPSLPNPRSCANLSIGDQAACDVTATGQRSNVSFTDGTVTVSTTTTCIGDCDHNTKVIVNEVVTCVNVALDTEALNVCPPCSSNGTTVLINDLVTAVNNDLGGCPTPP